MNATATMKPVVGARGAPPPVPPNKPIVPPKKEGTFLRRTESIEPPKFIKQQTIIANPAAAQNIQNQQTIAVGGHAEDEVRFQ